MLRNRLRIKVYATIHYENGLWDISAWHNGTHLTGYQHKEKKLTADFIALLHEYMGGLACPVVFYDGIEIEPCNNHKIGACHEFNNECFNYPCYH